MIESWAQAEAKDRHQDIVQLSQQAVRQAQAESRRLGVPNVYFIDGQVHYELADGRLSLTDPYPTRSIAKLP